MIIAWFSCGVTSAVACKIALSLYDDVQIYYIETGSGHPDNVRFISDCERWYGQPIHTIRSDKFFNVKDVLIKKRYINGPTGAACTFELKKQVRYKLEKELGSWDGQVWGFDFAPKEINRAIRFKQQYPDTKPLFLLIERQITKRMQWECFGKPALKSQLCTRWAIITIIVSVVSKVEWATGIRYGRISRKCLTGWQKLNEK